MNDPLGVGGVECIRDLYRQREQDIRLNGFPSDPVLQRHAFQKLHGDEGLIAVLADFVDGADVRVIERRSSAGLAAETLERLRVLG